MMTYGSNKSVFRRHNTLIRTFITCIHKHIRIARIILSNLKVIFIFTHFGFYADDRSNESGPIY